MTTARDRHTTPRRQETPKTQAGGRRCLRAAR